MKNLTLLRHAKSSWDHPDCTDRERPLNARGKADAPRMADAMRGQKADVMLCSPAVRARATAVFFSKALDCECREDPRLYGAGAGDLLAVIRGLDDRWQHVILVGHNPGLEELAGLLIPGFDRNLPTCAWLGIRLQATSWKDVQPGTGQEALFRTPKKIDGGRRHGRYAPEDAEGPDEVWA